MSCSVGSWMADGLDELVDCVRLQLGEDGNAVNAVVANEVVGDSLRHANTDKKLSESCWFGHCYFVVSLRVLKRVFCHHRRFLISTLAKDEIQVRGLRASACFARVGVLFNGPFGLLADWNR